jgi:hypothetical protein
VHVHLPALEWTEALDGTLMAKGGLQQLIWATTDLAVDLWTRLHQPGLMC